MFRPTRPSSVALKLGGAAVPSSLLRSMFLYLTMFLNEVNAVPSFGTLVIYQVCSMHVIVNGFGFKS
jgi:hypothetical protein